MNVRITGAVLAVVLGALLTGCADADDDKGGRDVLTLASVKPPQPSASKAPPEERPLVRTDTSDEEEERMYDAYQSCLEKNGVPARRGSGDKGGAPKAAPADPGLDAKYRKAEAACVNKEPEQVWERAKRLDPVYADKLRDWVTCIRSHGIDAWESDGFLAFESLPPENQLKKVDECQDKAFGKG